MLSAKSDPRKRIDLTSLFSRAVHLPHHHDGTSDYPQYPQALHCDTTVNQSKISYNSPSNVRSVCLSLRGCHVLYWLPPIQNGSPLEHPVLHSSYCVDPLPGKPFFIDPLRQRYETAGLRCLVEPLVFSNLEELWIDVGLLNCPAYEDVYEDVYEHLFPYSKSASVDTSILSAILEREISTPNKPCAIADTFPLLRSIIAVNTCHSITPHFHPYVLQTSEITSRVVDEAKGGWLAVSESLSIMEQIEKETGLSFAICHVSTGNRSKFTVGDYKFDTQFLVDFKKALQE